jgi:hypothetical protein
LGLLSYSSSVAVRPVKVTGPSEGVTWSIHQDLF